MPAGPDKIKEFRDTEWKQFYNYLQNVNLTSLKINQTTIEGVSVRIRTSGADDLASLHTKSITTAVTALAKAGYELPPLDFYLCASDTIPNVAMKTYTGGKAAPVILLGPKMWAKNPMMPGTNGMIVGGMAANGVRGVANQAYDGTQRFFGNPKQNAQGACIVIHELGHVLHEYNNPGIFWEEMSAIQRGQPSPNGNGWQNQSIAVSGYAGNNQLEFVAEVFAGINSGKDYGEAVLAVYGSLGGPVPTAVAV